MSTKVSQIKVYTNGTWQDIAKVHDGSGWKNFRGVYSGGIWYELDSGGYWVQVGYSFQDTRIQNVVYPSLTKMDLNVIVLADGGNNEINQYYYSEQNDVWTHAGGTPISMGNAGVASLNNRDVALIDTDNRYLKTYRNTDNSDTSASFSQIGNSLSVSILNIPGITALDSNTVVIVASYYDNMGTYSWDGTNWTQVGNLYNFSPSISIASITTLDSTTIAFIDNGNDELRTYSWDGTNWTQVGNSLSVAVGAMKMAYISSTRIALIVDGEDELRTYEWDGTNWSFIGKGYTINITSTPGMCDNGINEVAILEPDSAILTTYKYIE